MAASKPAVAPAITELDPKFDAYDYPIIAPVAANGHSGHLKPEQQAQVFQLRMMLESKGYTKRLDTLTLVGWARPWASLSSRLAGF